MNVVFLALMFEDESLNLAYKTSKSPIQMATHIFQSNLLFGLRNELGDKIKVVNIPPIGSFPINNSQFLIKGKNWGNDYVECGFLNLPFIKHLEQSIKITKKIDGLIEKGEKNVILIYSLYLPFLKAANEIKKRYPNVKICILQTDAVDGRNGMQKYMTKREIKKGNKEVQLARCADGFVILTKYLLDPLEAGDRRSIVVECICNEKQAASSAHKKSNNICLYTGSVDKEYGICQLIEAFIKLDNGELWICGDGDVREEIAAVAKTSDRIRYFGFVNSDKICDFRDKCDFLINPRRPTGTYTLYSFPSKTAEYLMSGKPTIMYKLEGIPDEYDEFLNYLESDNPKEIAGELSELFNRDYSELRNKAMKARDYMLLNKTRDVQAKRIISLLEDL